MKMKGEVSYQYGNPRLSVKGMKSKNRMCSLLPGWVRLIPFTQRPQTTLTIAHWKSKRPTLSYVKDNFYISERVISWKKQQKLHSRCNIWIIKTITLLFCATYDTRIARFTIVSFLFSFFLEVKIQSHSQFDLLSLLSFSHSMIFKRRDTNP